MTQLLDLTLLATNIQEEILFLESFDGIEPITEQQLRQPSRNMRWYVQHTHRTA